MLFGGDLNESDFQRLEARWIRPEDAQVAGLRRVNSIDGREMFGRKSGNLAGIILPNIKPGDQHVREYRIRLDKPELEYQIDGSVHETRRYLQPSGRPNLAYFPPRLPIGLLDDPEVPVIITEGEFKALALWRLAQYASESARFLPISLAGVWNFRGVTGKRTGPDGTRDDVKGIIPDIELLVRWKGRRLIIAYDADCASNPKVLAARSQLAWALIDRGAIVAFLEWDIEEGKGIDDRLAGVGPDRVLADIEALEFGGWRTRLLLNEDGHMFPCYENVALFLENTPEWAGVLGYNEFTGGYEIRNIPPAPISAKPGAEIEDHFETEIIRWLERRTLRVKPDLVNRVVDMIARKNPFHPVRKYLEFLPDWDRVPRIGTWLVDYCGVESSDEKPNFYANAIGEKFLVSAIARVFEPGCKCDYTIVFEGKQGSGKSTLLRTLAGEWFTDQLADFGSKDASMQLRGVWIIELAELDALNRPEMARVKAFLTQQTERFRVPYARRPISVPRQCVFAGTTNSQTFLKDETGNRRFWPIRTGTIDIAAVKRDRDQLWAEALRSYRAGTCRWLDDASILRDAEEEQRSRLIEDAWQTEIEHIIADQNSVTIPEVLARLGVETPRQDQLAANRVARCLQVAGWERYKKRLSKDEQYLKETEYQYRYRKVKARP